MMAATEVPVKFREGNGRSRGEGEGMNPHLLHVKKQLEGHPI